MSVAHYIAIMVLTAVGITSVATSGSPASKQTPAQPTHRKDIHMNGVVLTKSHCNGKMFYYVQLLKERPQEADESMRVKEARSRDDTDYAWFTLQLGYICDNCNRFVIADALYTNNGGALLTRVSRHAELEHLSSRFCEAIEVAEQRYEAEIRSSLHNLLRWLDNHIGPAPVVSEKETLILQKLHEFRTDLLSNRYANSLYGRVRSDQEYRHCVCGAQ